jgi:hypothetical protein
MAKLRLCGGWRVEFGGGDDVVVLCAVSERCM